MAHFDNLSVKQEIEKQQEQRAAGLVEGYEAQVDEGLIEGHAANVNILPVFFFSKRLCELTSRERAYFVGREIRLYEIAEGKRDL